MTTAITLWLLIGGGIVAYAAWAATAIAGGGQPWRYLAGAVAIYPLCVCAITAFWFSLAWVFRAPRPARARLGLAASARLFWNEALAIARFPRMAFYKWLVRDPRPAPAAAPVLLLHGVLCNAGVWAGFRKHLAARGLGPLYTLSYGPPLASIDVFAAQVARKIEYIRRATGARRVAIVSHSMGGLVARAYLRRFGANSVSALISFGAPHHGSVHARLFPGACLNQLRPGNEWLAALNGADDVEPPIPTTSIWSWHDSMVAPQTSGRLRGARNVELTGVGHNALLNDPRVRALVADELERIARDAVHGHALRAILA
ncbi:MAG TPA: alpha/beta fold hydrolase [Casimicrobiaceae bacterium]|nr:alpha/beta fold hydrolase [Casimicrobiaceae bacterium]